MNVIHVYKLQTGALTFHLFFGCCSVLIINNIFNVIKSFTLNLRRIDCFLLPLFFLFSFLPSVKNGQSSK